MNKDNRNFAVIGLGSFGTNVATTLFSLGHEVLAVDKNPDKVSAISDFVTQAAQADCTDINVLKALGIRNFTTVFICMGENLESSVVVTALLKELGVNEIVAKAHSDLHEKILKSLGASSVIYPERDMGIRVANARADANFIDFIELSNEYSIVEINCPASWIGKTLREADLRVRYGINILAIKHENELLISPSPDRAFIVGDTAVIVGANSDLNNIK